MESFEEGIDLDIYVWNCIHVKLSMLQLGIQGVRLVRSYNFSLSFKRDKFSTTRLYQSSSNVTTTTSDATFL